MKPIRLFKQAQQGVSIVELMVAIAIGLLITAAIASLYVSNKQSFSLQDEMSRLQEGVRLVSDSVSRDARYAGYLGCSSLTGAQQKQQNFLILSQTGVKTQLYQFAQGMDGVESVSSSWVNAPQRWRDIIPSGAAEPKEKTDIVAFYGANGGSSTILQSEEPSGKLTAPNAAYVRVNFDGKEAGACKNGGDLYNGYLCSNDIVVASNCKSAVIFQAQVAEDSATNTLKLQHVSAGSPGNSPASWNVASKLLQFYAEEGSEINELAARIYYVGKDNKLYLLDSSVANTPTPLVDNVEDLQVEYGLALQSSYSASCFVGADKMVVTKAAGTSTCSAGAWSDVVSIRYQFTIRSSNKNLLPTAKEYLNVAGQTVTDRALRRTVSGVATLRNRVK